MSARGTSRAAQPARGAVAGWAALACAMLAASDARAQDFAPPAPAAVAAAAGVLLDTGLPPPDAGTAVEAWGTRWLGLSGLATRGAGVQCGWRAARAGLGVSQTGDQDFGWSAAGIALGGGGGRGGAAFRLVARRDRTPAIETTLGPGTGAELGGGAWLAPLPHLRIWATRPQAFLRGAAPPLVRGLEIGGEWSDRTVRAWLASEAVPGRNDAHRAGLAVSRGPSRVWVEAREAPVRGSVGLRVRVRSLAIAAAVEAHPVLGETTRLGLILGDRDR